MKAFLALSLLLISSLSFANSALLEAECLNCSYPQSTSYNFTFEEASKKFATAKRLSPSELIGSWKQVAGTQVADLFVASQLMGYNENGIQNENGVMTLEVNSISVTGGFFETEPTKKNTITIKSLNSKPMGPYELVADATGQACFSTATSEKAYYAYECRGITKNNSKILCSITLHGNGVELNDELKKWDGKAGLYLGFVRK